MQAQRRRDTGPELEIRRAIHRLGLRYFVDRRPMRQLRRKADLIFPTERVAVFVDGCFWHSCPVHGSIPKANRRWWQAKFNATRRRDEHTDEVLRTSGWTVVRVWEHDACEAAAARVAGVVRDIRAEISSH